MVFLIYTIIERRMCIMLLSVLFFIFALLLMYAGYFFYTGKAAVLLTTTDKKLPMEAATFFKVYGVLFFIGGLASLVLIFFHPNWLAFTVLVFVVFTMLLFIIGLNKRM